MEYCMKSCARHACLAHRPRGTLTGAAVVGGDAMTRGGPEGGDAPELREPFLAQQTSPSTSDEITFDAADIENGAQDDTAICRRRAYRPGWTPLLILAASVSTLSSAVPVGYNIGVINTPGHIIRQFCNESVRSHYGVEMSQSGLQILWSTIVSIFLIGGVTGSLSGGILADKYGRKGVIILCNVLGLASAFLFVVCKYANSVEMLILARIIIGFSAGLVTSTIPMYLTEIAPVRLRGAMGVICPLGITTGVLLGQFMGLDWLLGTESAWHYLLGLYAPLILSTVLLLPTLPESPKYLYVVKGEDTRAVQELSRIRKLPEDELTEEILDLRQATKSEEESGGDWTAGRVLKSKEFLLPLVLVCALQAGQQCVGINAVFYYSTTIFRSAGLSEKSAQYANLGAGFINFLVSIIAIPLVNACGRRILMLISLFTSGICLVMLGIVIYVIDAASWVPYIAIVALYAFVFFYGIGTGPVPYFIGAELFDVGPRPIAMSFGSMANWSGNFLVGMTFPSLLSLIGASSFFVFAAVAFGLAFFLSVYFPETKGHDPADIAEMLKDGFSSRIHHTTGSAHQNSSTRSSHQSRPSGSIHPSSSRRRTDEVGRP